MTISNGNSRAYAQFGHARVKLLMLTVQYFSRQLITPYACKKVFPCFGAGIPVLEWRPGLRPNILNDNVYQ